MASFLPASMRGKPVKVVDFVIQDDSVKPEVDVPAIKEIIKASRAESLALFVISIAGVCRSGKSFFLNLLLHYIQWQRFQNFGPDDKWSASSDPITGLSWTQSTSGVTKGIWMWDRVLKFRCENEKEIGILLLDSQGTSDSINSSCQGVDTLIMHLNMALADVLLLNINNYFRLEDQTMFKLCDVLEKRHTTPIKRCKDLVLLHRNWQNNNDQNGYKPEMWYRNYVMKARESGVSQAIDNIKLIEKTFERIDCATLPFPGKKVSNAVEGCEILLREIDEDFVEAVEDVIQNLIGLASTDAILANGRNFVASMEILKEKLVKGLPLPQELQDPEDLNRFQQLSAYHDKQMEKFRDLLFTVELGFMEFNGDIKSAERDYDTGLAQAFEIECQITEDFMQTYNKLGMTNQSFYRKIFESFFDRMLVEINGFEERLRVALERKYQAASLRLAEETEQRERHSQELEEQQRRHEVQSLLESLEISGDNEDLTVEIVQQMSLEDI